MLQQFIKILKEQDDAQEKADDLCLRLLFCHYLSVCAFTTLARAEDNMQDYVGCLMASCIQRLTAADKPLSSGLQARARISASWC
jgi:hypothetical protein